MSKVRHLAEGMALPEWFLDSLQELVSSYVSPNFAVTQLNPTTLRVVAGADNDQVSISLSKSGVSGWRHNQATVTAGVPGGLSIGDHDIYVTGFANSFGSNPTPPPTELDSTSYGFFLILKASGTTPSGAGGSNQEMYRKIGTFHWDGASISQVVVSFGSPPPPPLLSGTLALRPAASAVATGTQYYATDQVATYLCVASAWVRTSIPAGHCGFTIATTPSPGYILLNGQAWPSTTGIYADLYARFGSPPAVPALAGRVPVGQWSGDPRTTTVGALMGEFDHALSNGEMPAHNHTGLTGLMDANPGLYWKQNAGVVRLSTNAGPDDWAPVPDHHHGIAVDGGSAPHNNMQPGVVVNYEAKL